MSENGEKITSLYDFLAESNKDTYDTVDLDADFILIAKYVPELKAYTEYEKFCVNIEKKVMIGASNNGMVIAHWTDFFKTNGMQFRSFARQFWHINPFNEDFFDECLRRIHNMMSGKDDEKTYLAMNTLLNICE